VSALSDLPRRRRGWPLLVAALAVIMAVAVAATVWWITSGTESLARSRWQPPQQKLLPSMRAQPIAGWTTDVTALGLPPGSRITTGTAPWLPGPIIETPDHRALLLARSASPTTSQWWLTAIDVRDGHPLFSPIALNETTRTPSCFVNGTAVVCIDDDQTAATAWVIDGQTGKLTYTGPTDVRTVTGRLEAKQAGNYLVAATEGQGLYGVGFNAETTWFIPNAAVRFGYHNDDVAAGGSTTLFSLNDGKAISPDFPKGAHVHSMAFFDGGFTAEFVVDDNPSFFQFFDNAGKLTSTEHVGGFFVSGSTGNLASIVDAAGYGIYGPTGDKLLDIPGDAPKGMQLIGTRLWVGGRNSIDATYFQSYDMRTGEKGNACEFDAYDGYLGTDGSVFVRSPWNINSDDLAKAYDLTTCKLVWSIPRPKGSLGRVGRIGDTLIRLSDNGTELSSLVAPG
jgi:hypothetical protein